MVSNCPRQSKVVYESGDMTIPEIKKAIRYGISDSANFSKEYASKILQKYGRTERALYQIWKDARSRWPYGRDPKDQEIARSPCQMDRDNRADCKDFTIWVSGVLENMGIHHWQKIIFYDDQQTDGHIFVIASIDGKNIVVDPVHRVFNREFPSRSSVGISGGPQWTDALWLIVLFAGWKMIK